MTVDLTSKNHDYAIFLPSISSVYTKHVSGGNKLINSPRNGKLPSFMKDFEDLDFLQKDKLFYYNSALYSAGHAVLDIEKAEEQESMIMNRPKDSFILGDSGGFQIATGVLQFPWNDLKGQNADKIRNKILTWLERTSDYAMLLDFPTSAISNPRTSLNSFKECLEGSLINYDYFVKNRKGDTKYLNVLQGRSISEEEMWFDKVKDYPFEGWAFGGAVTTSDFEIQLKRIIEMRDGKYLEENSEGNRRNWIHILGQTRPIAAIAFTEIQRNLRSQIGPDVTLSFDSASAFITIARGNVFGNSILTKEKFSNQMVRIPDDKNLVDSNTPFPWESAIGSHLTYKDICVKDQNWLDRGDKVPKSSWDTFTYVLLMCHNVERQIRTIQQANRLADLPVELAKNYVPEKVIVFKEIVKDIFASETPHDEIHKHHKVLNSYLGTRHGKGVSVGDNILSTFFDLNDNNIDISDENDVINIEAELNREYE